MKKVLSSFIAWANTWPKFFLAVVIFISCVGIANAGHIVRIIGGGGGGQNYSDDFNRADSDNPGAGWTEVTGDWDIVSNALVFVNAVNQTYGVISYANESDTVEQYTKTTIASWGGGAAKQYNQLTAIMRYDDGAGTYYQVLSNQTETVWYDDNGEVQRDNLAFADGDSRSVVVTGTGDDAVIGIWKNTANDTPYSYGPNCINTALPCWDDANDAPDLAFTDNPTALADTGKAIVIQTYESTSASGGDVTIDNFFFGDCP